MRMDQLKEASVGQIGVSFNLVVPLSMMRDLKGGFELQSYIVSYRSYMIT